MVTQMVKSIPAMWETSHTGKIHPWVGLEKEMTSHYWNCYLENSMDRGAWWAFYFIYKCLVKSNLKSMQST